MTVIAEPTQQEIQGKAQRNDEDALLLLALISLGDIEEAAIYWGRLSEIKYAGLIDAVSPVEKAKGFETAWDVQRMAYLKATGEIIPDSDVRAAVLSVLLKSQAEALRDTSAMLAGAVELADWQQRMLNRIKRLQLAVYAVGIGGRSQITADQLVRTKEAIPEVPLVGGTLGDVIAYQFGRLQRFAEQIEKRHSSADTQGDIEARVAMYESAAYPTFEQARAVAAENAGMNEELNVLSAVDHCRAKPESLRPDCPSQTKLGWVPLGTLTPPGLRICGVNCRCSIKYRKGAASIAA